MNRIEIDIDIPETSKNVLKLIAEKLFYQNRKGLEKYGESIDEVGDGDYDWQDMAMEELIDGIQYVLKENGKLRRENETLRKDNALLYDQNDRLQMANRGIMIGVRKVVKGQLDLF